MKKALKIGMKYATLMMLGAVLTACALKGQSNITVSGKGPTGGSGGGNTDTNPPGPTVPQFGTMSVGARDFASFKAQLKAATGIDPLASVADIDPVTAGVQTLSQVWDTVNGVLPQSSGSEISAASLQGAMVLAEAFCSANSLLPTQGVFAGTALQVAAPTDADLKTFADRMARVMWRESAASANDIAELKALHATLFAGQTNANLKGRTAAVGICAVAMVSGSGLEM